MIDDPNAYRRLDLHLASQDLSALGEQFLFHPCFSRKAGRPAVGKALGRGERRALGDRQPRAEQPPSPPVSAPVAQPRAALCSASLQVYFRPPSEATL